MKLKTLFFTAIGALALTSVSANAGSGKMVMPPPSPIAEPQLFGANVSVGYDSHYIFRGVSYGEDSVWGSIEYSLPFTPDFIDLTVGTWYQNPINGVPTNPAHEDELDLYVTATVDITEGVSIWFGYAAYLYPEAGGGSTNEVGTGVDFSILDLIDLGFAGYYDFDIEGWYFSGGASHTLEICDGFGLTAGGSIGYQNDYNAAGSDWNDVRAFVELPISLTDRATLTPYIAHSWSLDAIDSFQEDELYGGVSLSVDF